MYTEKKTDEKLQDFLLSPLEVQMGLPNQKDFNQYFTPRWIAEEIVDRQLSGLKDGSLVLELGCGDGRFLMAIPDRLEAMGVELDPVQAQLARNASGRNVITGNFLTVDLPRDVEAVVGNPPFVAEAVSGLLDRSHEVLVEGGQCSLILPAYILQTSSKVEKFSEKWSIKTELMPRNIFPGLSLPLTFTVFTKDRARKLFGFFMYREVADVSKVSSQTKELLCKSSRKGSVWRQAVNDAFDRLGSGVVRLKDLYEAVSHKPQENNYCEQQIRKILQSYPEFIPVDRGVWSRASSS